MKSASDLPRASQNQIRLGTVAEVDLARARCRVKAGEIQTDYIPWFVPRAGQTIEWSAPSEGEQVLLLSPGGDMSGALVLRGLYSDQFAAPSASESEHLVRFPDGALIKYDHASHELVATLPAGGKAEVTADAGVTINGPLIVNGDTTINGAASVSETLTADIDVVGGGVSLKSHLTKGVQPGSGLSGTPQ